MTIYKVQAWVNKRVKSKGQSWINREYEKTEIVIDNLEYAEKVFHILKNTVENYTECAGYWGRVELFIPHIHENRILACWPDDNKYIEQYIKEEK